MSIGLMGIGPLRGTGGKARHGLGDGTATAGSGRRPLDGPMRKQNIPGNVPENIFSTIFIVRKAGDT